MTPPQRSDYDNPWKEALALYFQPFMAFFFPQIESNIDWDKGYEFLDKEFQQIVREAEQGKTYADKLVKVWQKNGSEIWLLIHVEIQSQVQSEFPERMYVYNYRIFDRYRQPVLSLAILADDNPDWRPNSYSRELWGGIIVAAHLTNQQTRRNVNQRYDGKLSIAKSLYQKGYSRGDILELFRLIDWMINLPEMAEQEFKKEIQRFEEEKQVAYITSVERIARQEGIIQKGQEDIIEVLEVRFSEIPSALVQKINQIEDPDLLKTLLREAITIDSLAAFPSLT